MQSIDRQPPLWAIVVGDDHGPEWVPYCALDLKAVPVQYCRLSEASSPFQRAMHLAAWIASPSRVLMTALEDHRSRWEPYTWFVRPAMRFVSPASGIPNIALALAILSLAELSPSTPIVIIPARSHVAHEEILRNALRHVVTMLPGVPEGVATLGMVDIDEAVDEDYLVVQRAAAAAGLRINGVARRPNSWVARHLRRQGAVIASGILVGYAGVFAAHLSKHWPGVAGKLAAISRLAAAAGSECIVPSGIGLEIPSAVRHCLRWDPPIFPQRVFTVSQCGWSSLKSPQEIARIADFLSAERMFQPRRNFVATDMLQV